MKIVDFVSTGSVEQASTVLKQLGAKGILMAGGTAFHFFSSEDEKTAVVPDDEQLKFISENNGFFEIGSFASISDLREFSNQGWVLDRVAEEFATQQIRNMSTLGGNISQVFPWSDFPVVLLALSAEINVLEEKESRAYEAVDFFRQQPGKFLKNGKIVKSVKIPVLEKGEGFGYKKEKRTNAAFSTLTVAVYVKLEKGSIKDIKIVSGASMGMPKRLGIIENELKGKKADTGMLKEKVKALAGQYSWKGKEGTTKEYAGCLAQTRITDAIVEAFNEAESEVE